MTHPTMQDTLQ